ncbi:MAG: hypothetical protein JWM64_2902, partial [Frankiales bacterium]|nr:hypothetical protein [Frankiales bacterium]
MTVPTAPDPGPRVAGPAARPPLLLLGLGGLLVAAALVGTALSGTTALVVAVVVLQLVLVLGALALVDAPAAGGAFAIAATAGLVGDVLVVRDDGDVGALAGVVALALVASLLHQLARRARDRVTEALSDTLLVVVLVACAACLPALRALDGGRDVALAALAA